MVFLLGTPAGTFARFHVNFLNKIRLLPVFSLCLFLATLVMPLTHSAHAADKKLQDSTSQNQVKQAVSKEIYLFKAEDIININVLGETELSKPYISDYDGMILMPWIGKVQIGGKSAHDIEKDVTLKLQNGYLKNPTVSISQYSPQDIGKAEFYIMGEVENPGRYDLPNAPPFLLKAVAIAGGFKTRAQTKNFEIIRHIDGTNYKIKNNSANTIIQSGDVIVVNSKNNRILD